MATAPSAGPAVGSAFLSHSSADAAMAHQLCNLLEARKLQCWLAPRNINPGASYADEIVRGVQSCNALILLATPASVTSDNVLNELEQAHKRKKTILTVMVGRPNIPPQLDYYISRLHWIESSSGAMDDVAGRLFDVMTGRNSWQQVSSAPSLKRSLKFNRRVLFGFVAAVVLVLGLSIWRVVSAVLPDHSIIPAEVKWPIDNVPGIAKAATDRVHDKWQKDAILISVTAKLLEGGDGGMAFASSPLGGVTVTFLFFSPHLRQMLFYLPLGHATMQPAGPPIGRSMSSLRALPQTFMDLPQATRIATQRGMKGRIHTAEIQDWAPGTSVGGTSARGVVWVISSDENERVTVEAGGQTVQLGDLCLACANNADCFQKYNALLPGPRCNQLPRQDLNNCRAYRNSNDRSQLAAARQGCASVLRYEKKNSNLIAVIQNIDSRLQNTR